MMDVCNCNAYTFPHRMGGGKCEAYKGCVFCSECGLPCETHREVDYETMPYGSRNSIVRRDYCESTCCHAPLLYTQGELLTEKEA